MQLTTSRTLLTATALVFLTGALARAVSTPAAPPDTLPAGVPSVERGAYLVRARGCHDCHTPWKVGPKGPEPDMSRARVPSPIDPDDQQ